MWDAVRRVGAGLASVAILLAVGRQEVVSQQPAPAANPNIYVNPNAASGRVIGPAGLGAGSPASSVGRLGYGSMAPSGLSTAGAGSLAASYANPSMGYGSLTNNGNNGNGNNGGNGGYGYGMYGTQWMMNPYQGYLSGAASLTTAQAQYWQGIQQAKLTRQEAIRSSIQTRRAMIEEAEWERAHAPDPEKIRQAALQRELDHARVSPPLHDVWSARSLNALLRHLIAQQGQGAKGPKIQISEDTLSHINLSIGDNGGNVGLLKNLKNGGDLHWPLPLQREFFKDGREGVNRLLQAAYKSAANGHKPDTATISDLRGHLKDLKSRLYQGVSELTPDEFTEAKRYLDYVDKAITALKSPNVGNFVNGNWQSKAQTVGELVQFMREQGLWFAPATPKDEPFYVSLYYALASFDRGIQRVARDSSE